MLQTLVYMSAVCHCAGQTQLYMNYLGEIHHEHQE